MISEQKMEEALVFLAKTDEESAGLKEKMLRQEYAMDLARRRCFLVADGNIEERKAKAEIDEEVKGYASFYYDCVGEYEKMKAKRSTAELVVEVWRSLNANRRSGNI